MNDYMLAGIVVVGTLVAMGAGGWLVRVFRGRRDSTPQA